MRAPGVCVHISRFWWHLDHFPARVQGRSSMVLLATGCDQENSCGENPTIKKTELVKLLETLDGMGWMGAWRSLWYLRYQLSGLVSAQGENPDLRGWLGSSMLSPHPNGPYKLLSNRARLWERVKTYSPCLCGYSKNSRFWRFFSPFF